MKQRVLLLVRNIVLSVVVLAVVVGGAGVAYTWYMGGGPSTPAAAAPVEPVVVTTTQKSPRRTPAPDAPASVSVQQISSPVAPGSVATLTVRSNPTATCKIAVVYSNKQVGVNAALVEKATDEYGIADWQWTVEKTAPLGRAAVTVTCALDEKRSAVVVGDLEIAR